MTRTLCVYIILISPGSSIFKESRYCIPLYCLELLTVFSATNISHRFVVYSYTSAQSTFVKSKVNVLKDNVLKDTQILTKTTYVQKEGYTCTSAQSTIAKPNVNVLKYIQILTKTSCMQKEAENVLIPFSSWIILCGYCWGNITTSQFNCCPQLIHLLTSTVISLFQNLNFRMVSYRLNSLMQIFHINFPSFPYFCFYWRQYTLSYRLFN